MKRVIPFLVIIFFFSSQTLQAQSSANWPKTLLWRISGNGLAKNSFLYGTMHLQDKRLFYFTDSLYHYLEQSDGYALEIDLTEFMDSVIQKLVNDKQEEIIDKRRFKGKDRKKIVDSLIENVKKRNDKASKKQLEHLREEKLRKAMKNKEMPTIMDAYLYGIARKHGKWLGGVEDVQYQLMLSDELGAEVTSEELLAPDEQLTAAMEDMIKTYLAADLDKIEKYSTGQYSDKLEDMMFLRRNIKMARRMDSLAHVRSMFFSVGAAHLPGDSGVINLLKQQGYKVEPIFSSKKVDPLKYASKLDNIPWIDVEDEKKAYKIQMPGKPSDLNMFDGAIKMKFYVDITTLTYFMSGSTFTQENVDLNKVMAKFSENTDGEVLSQKTIQKDNAKAVEGVVHTDGYYYKVQYIVRDNTVYMLIAGGDKKETLESADVKKFFQSFVIGKSKIVAEQKEWTAFGLDEKAFSIQFPGIPKKNKSIEKKAEGTNWDFTVHDYIDAAAGMYYMVQIRDLRPGYYFTGDSVYFASFRENFSNAVKEVTREEKLFVQSFPAYQFDGISEDGGIIYKTRNINRGNRVYTLVAGGAINDENKSAIDQFLASFVLKDYKKSEWKRYETADQDFSTFLPSEIKRKISDEEKEESEADKDEMIYYLSFDENESVSYYVFKTIMPPYYWISGDSLFFDRYGHQYKNESDSILSKRDVTNGKLKGVEWVIQMIDNNVRKKIRQVLSGDTLYTLMSFIPSQYIESKESQQFFEHFRVKNENTNHSIFRSKAVLIFKDLQSSDSMTFAKASEAIPTSEFSKDDLPLLHQGLLSNYADDTLDYYSTTRNKIINAIESIADSSTVSFIAEHFDKVPAKKEALKFDLLEVLASYKTGHSYSVLKKLLLNHTPVKRDDKELSYGINDSLELTRSLFPEILRLSNNTLFAERIIELSRELLDSGLISLEMLQPYKLNFLHSADTILTGLKKMDEEIYGYQYLDMLYLLAAFNDAKCNEMLQQYLRLNSLMIKQEAVIGLLKNKQPVISGEIEKLAADKIYRREIYDNLKKINKLAFFPIKYKTQRYLAESDLFIYASDDEDEPSALNYIGERTVSFKGKKYRFYLYKVVYNYESEEREPKEEKYLGIVGGFSPDIKKVEVENEVTGIYYTEEFDSKKIDKHLGNYLRGLEGKEIVKYSE
jgi:uncharacterized protein YbaP (TraB family)